LSWTDQRALEFLGHLHLDVMIGSVVFVPLAVALLLLAPVPSFALTDLTNTSLFRCRSEIPR